MFFGREQERDIVASNLIASRLTLLYAPTGVGKSSLLHAAVVPKLQALAREQADDDVDLPFYVFAFASWQDDPVQGLTRAIAQVLEESYGRESSADRSGTLSQRLAAWTESLHADLFVILDQFEEYFLYHGGDASDRFATQFAEAVNDTALRVHFLVSLTEDALAKLDVFKGTIPGLFRNYLRIDYLDREAAGEAIRGPLDAYNQRHPMDQFEVEAKLIDDVLEGAGVGKVAVGQVGAGTVEASQPNGPQQEIETAHLQMVMDRVWDEEAGQGSRVLRAATLQELGGTDKIVRSHLDEELKSLSEQEQDIIAGAFEQLVTPSGTKIAHTAADLADMASVPELELVAVLNHLATGGRRVLRDIGPAPGQREDRYQIFHDILAPAILDWRGRHQVERKRVEEEERLRREHDESLRRVRRRALVGLGVVVAISFAVIAVLLLHAKQHESDLANSRRMAAVSASDLSSDPEKSLQEALAAHPTRTDEAALALRRAVSASHLQSILSGHKNAVNTASFNRPGTTIVTASDDWTARTWNANTGKTLRVLNGHTNAVNTASFDPSGTKVVTASDDGTARIWDANTGKSLHILRVSDAGVSAADFDPEGRWIVTAGEDGTAQVWDTETGVRLAGRKLHRDWIDRAVFSSDGATIATAGDDGQAYLWQWQTAASPRALFSQRGPAILDVQFDTTGRVLTAGPGKKAEVWSRTGQLISTFAGHSNWVDAARFAPDGRSVVTASDDGTARVWDVNSGALLVELRSRPESVTDVDVAVANGGLHVVTAGSSGTPKLWRLPRNVVLTGHGDEVWDAEFSHDGRSVVTSSADGTARVWDALSGRQLVPPLAGHDNYAVASYGPENRIVTVDKTTVRVWDRNGHLLRVAPVLPSPPAGDDSWDLSSAKFGPTGDVIYVADNGGRVYRWRWQSSPTPSLVVGSSLSGTTNAFDLSPDGKRFVIASSDRTATLWNAATGVRLEVLRGHTGIIYSARFAPDGRTVVTAGSDGTARLWNVRTGKTVRVFVAGASLTAAAFDPATGRVVTGDEDGVIRVFASRTGELLSELKEHSDYINSVVFSPDGKFVLSASDDRTARIYDPCASCSTVSRLRAKAIETVKRVRHGESTQWVSPYTLAPGDCYDEPRGRKDSGWVIPRPCAASHDAEMFGTLTYRAPLSAAFREKTVEGYADRYCSGSLFSKYVGVGTSASKFQVWWWRPNRGSWDRGDRQILCEVRVAHGRSSGSARDSDR